jgi:predicted secreted protein
MLNNYFIYGLRPLSLLFYIGVFFLMLGLAESGPPTRAMLESVRHTSLIIAVMLTSLYYLLLFFKRYRVQKGRKELKFYRDFTSIFFTTLSSELCSCLHPALILDLLGIAISIPTQVKIGSLLMIITFIYQLTGSHGLWKALSFRCSSSKFSQIILSQAGCNSGEY